MQTREGDKEKKIKTNGVVTFFFLRMNEFCKHHKLLCVCLEGNSS